MPNSKNVPENMHFPNEMMRVEHGKRRILGIPPAQNHCSAPDLILSETVPRLAVTRRHIILSVQPPNSVCDLIWPSKQVPVLIFLTWALICVDLALFNLIYQLWFSSWHCFFTRSYDTLPSNTRMNVQNVLISALRIVLKSYILFKRKSGCPPRHSNS